MKPEEIRKVLTRDALAETEQMTGASYKESPFTRQMGLLNHLEAVRDREVVMLATGDTTLSNDLERYLSIARRIGFKVVLEIPFVGESYSDEPAPHERLLILWRDGILLCLDTYGATEVNGSQFYFNLRPSDRNKSLGVRSNSYSAKADPGVQVGHHDGREGLAFHIAELERQGSFLNQWVESPFLWLLCYRDTKGEDYDYNAINKARISLLPEDVRKAITPIAVA